MKLPKSSLLLLLLSALAFVPAQAANRTVKVVAPAEVSSGSPVTVLVSASTDAEDGEQIGFLHAQYSIDDGKTWVGLCFETNLGDEWTRRFELNPAPKGGKLIVRARAAFRGGKAGDVDFSGAAIAWNDSWEKWRTPPTKYAIIRESAH
jgi:hypothetical protein